MAALCEALVSLRGTAPNLVLPKLSPSIGNMRLACVSYLLSARKCQDFSLAETDGRQEPECAETAEE